MFFILDNKIFTTIHYVQKRIILENSNNCTSEEKIKTICQVLIMNFRMVYMGARK